MNVIYILLFLLSVATMTCFHSYIFNEKYVVLDVVGGNNFFIILFLLISIPQILTGHYSVALTLCLVLLAGFILLLICYIYHLPYRKQNKHITNREYLLVIVVVCMISTCFLTKTTEDIRSVSDQGAYFTYSILLAKGDLSEVRNIDYVGDISEQVDEGLHNLREKSTIYYFDENFEPNTYYLHALATWCVFPALWIKMFGLWKGMRSLTWMYVVIVINMYIICRRVQEVKKAKYLALSLFALSPLTLYIAKAGLSEILFLMLFVLAIRYGVIQDRMGCIIAGVSLGLIGFIHASILIYIPILFFLLCCASIYNSNFFVSNFIFFIMYSASVWYDDYISPIYIRKEYGEIGKRIFLGKIDMYSKGWIVYLLISVCCVLCVFANFYIMKAALFQKLITELLNKSDVVKVLCVLLIAIRTIEYCYKIGFTDLYMIDYNKLSSWGALRNTYVNKGVISWSYLNFTNVLRLTGIAGFISFLLVKPSRHGVFLKLMYCLNLYCLVYFLVFNCDTPFNYYASRYFVPILLPVTTIVIAASIRKDLYVEYIIIGALMYFRYFLFSFVTGASMYGEYEYLKNTLQNISSGSVVLCNSESEYATVCLAENLRIINDNKVFNLENKDEIIKFFGDENYYIISDYDIAVPNEFVLDSYDVYKSQWSFGNGGNGRYAMKNGEFDIPIYIYEMKARIE